MYGKKGMLEVWRKYARRLGAAAPPTQRQTSPPSEANTTLHHNALYRTTLNKSAYMYYSTLQTTLVRLYFSISSIHCSVTGHREGSLVLDTVVW